MLNPRLVGEQFRSVRDRRLRLERFFVRWRLKEDGGAMFFRRWTCLRYAWSDRITCLVASVVLAIGFRRLGHRGHDGVLRNSRLIKLSDGPAFPHHKHSVRTLYDLFDLRRNHQYSQPFCGQLSDQGLDFLLRPDVNSAGWFIQN